MYIGSGSHTEAGRHGEARADQLAQICCLAPGDRERRPVKRLQGDNKNGSAGHALTLLRLPLMRSIHNTSSSRDDALHLSSLYTDCYWTTMVRLMPWWIVQQR